MCVCGCRLARDGKLDCLADGAGGDEGCLKEGKCTVSAEGGSMGGQGGVA